MASRPQPPSAKCGRSVCLCVCMHVCVCVAALPVCSVSSITSSSAGGITAQCGNIDHPCKPLRIPSTRLCGMRVITHNTTPRLRTVPLPHSCASEVELGHQERSRAITKDSNSLFCMVSGSVLPQTGKAFLYPGQNSHSGRQAAWCRWAHSSCRD